MKILIVSDSHGDTEAIRRAVEREGEEAIDVIVHAGDYARDIQSIQTNAKQYAVKGNCDNPIGFERESCLFDAGGVRIYLVHGHKQGVKRSLSELASQAAKLGADLCIFGHTHIPLLNNIGGILFVNPGTVSARKSYSQNGSYAVVTVEPKGGITNAQIKNL